MKGVGIAVFLISAIFIFQPMLFEFHGEALSEKIVIPPYMSDWKVDRNEKISYSSFININEENRSDSSIATSRLGPMNSSWPMQSHDMHHTGRTTFSTANNSGTEIWRFQAEELGEVWSAPVVDDKGVVYLGTLSYELYGVYPNGTKKWTYKTGGLIWSSCALGDDGTVYVTSDGSKLIAIDQNGVPKWIFGAGDCISSSPTISVNGTIYFGTMAGNFFAVNPNGTEQWHIYLGGNLISSPAVGLDNTIYVGTTSNHLFAVNPNGTLKWQYEAGQFKGNPSIAEDGTVYAPSFDGYLYAFYPNGTVRWKASTGDSVSGRGIALAKDGTIYIGTDQLRAFYPNGTLKWSSDLHGSIYGTVPALSDDGIIYVAAGPSLVAVNSVDGTERWSKQLALDQIHSSPCIGPDNRVYVGSDDYWKDVGYLHAFGLGQTKNITIEEPNQGHWYLFNKDMGTLKNEKTVIIGSVKIKVKASMEQEIDHVDFYVSHFKEVEPDFQLQYSDTTPPFEWTMNKYYGNDLFKHLPFDVLSIRVVGWYKGGSSWTQEIQKIWYFHVVNIKT